MEEEIWKPIKAYEGLYEISNFGYVISLKKGGILNTTKNKEGFNSVILSKEGKRKAYTLHYLIAEYFLPQPDGTTGVIHKDKNKSNNNVNNLTWINKKAEKICSYCGKSFTYDTLQTWANKTTCRKCNNLQWQKDNPTKKKDMANKWVKNQSENLTNSYIVSQLIKTGINRKDITPDIIEIKRNTTKIKRLCKQLNN